MQQININELRSHPRNNEFFDDITGDSWKAFLESIESSGIIEPIVVTQNMVIVSGPIMMELSWLIFVSMTKKTKF